MLKTQDDYWKDIQKITQDLLAQKLHNVEEQIAFLSKTVDETEWIKNPTLQEKVLEFTKIEVPDTVLKEQLGNIVDWKIARQVKASISMKQDIIETINRIIQEVSVSKELTTFVIFNECILNMNILLNVATTLFKTLFAKEKGKEIFMEFLNRIKVPALYEEIGIASLEKTEDLNISFTIDFLYKYMVATELFKDVGIKTLDDAKAYYEEKTSKLMDMIVEQGNMVDRKELDPENIIIPNIQE